MPEDEKANNPSVKADNNSTAVGNIGVGGSVEGDISVGGTHTHYHYYGNSESTKLPETYETIPYQHFEPEIVLIPEGEFLMGSPVGEGIPSYEIPQHKVYLSAYYIGIKPVTNIQFQSFVSDTKILVAPVMRWEGQSVPVGKGNHPVTGVTWYEARDYCVWLSAQTGRRYSLPNEAQWEKACRGGRNLIYPWGDEFDPQRCNYGRPALAAVDAYIAQNEYGCFDLVGNVRQWTCSLWGEKRVTPSPEFTYPWKEDYRNNLDANPQIRRVVRGSAMKDPIKLHRCSTRNGQVPDDRGLPGARHGFRVVMAVK